MVFIFCNSSIILHSTMRVLPMLQQICSGMRLYGLLSLVQQEPNICRQLFVPGSFHKASTEYPQKICIDLFRKYFSNKLPDFILFCKLKVDADFLVRALSPVFSEKGTVRRQRESRVINFLQDFVQDMEDEGE